MGTRNKTISGALAFRQKVSGRTADGRNDNGSYDYRYYVLAINSRQRVDGHNKQGKGKPLGCQYTTSPIDDLS